MPDALEIVARFTADTADLEAGAEKAKGALGGISAQSLVMGGAIVAGAGLAVAAIASMTEAAAADRDEQAKLEQAITAAGAATATSTDQVNAAIAAGQAKAFSDTETRDALQSLVTSTHDVTTATGLLATAQDIARFAGVDLATAADAVAKANAGSDGALTKLIPGLQKGATASDTLAAAQKAAAGQAELFAGTTEGQMQIANDSFGELQEAIGTAFLPILDELVPALVPIITTMGELVTAVMPALIAVIHLVVDAVKIILGVLKTFFDLAGQVASVISKNLQPVLATISGVLKGVGDAIAGVVHWLQDLLGAIADAIGAVGRFLDSINPLKGFQLPSLPFSLSAPMSEGYAATTRSARSGGVSTSTTVNIHVASADPEQVVRAIRRYAASNGGGAPFSRSLDT